MKKLLLISSFACAITVGAQFSSGTVSLGSSGMTVKLDTSPALVIITLTGADTSYLGIGFGPSGMANGSDGFIYNSSSNRDYTYVGIGGTPTADAVQDWTETSNTVSGGIRTVIATRSLAGGAGDTAISNAAGTVSINYAKGPGTALSSGYHGGSNRGYAVLTKSAVLSTQDIAAQNKENFMYPNPAKETVSFKNGDKIKTVSIYESSGRAIKTVKLQDDTLNIADLKPGIYYLEITLKDGTLSFEKLIKE